MRNEPAKQIIITNDEIDTFIKVLDWTKEAMFNRYGNPIYYERYKNYMTVCNKLLDDFHECLDSVSYNQSKTTNDFLEQERRRIEGHYESKSNVLERENK